MHLSHLTKNIFMRFFSIFALTTILVLSGCGGQPTPQTSPSQPAVSSPAASPKAPASSSAPASPSASPKASTSPAASPSKIPYGTTAPPRAEVTTKDIILATTTSTRDSGLLDELIPIFQQQTGYQVKTIAIGTGAALAMGQRGDADVLLVHDPPNEVKLMDGGYGTNRQLIMHNDFIIVGPSSDPAKIKGTTSVVDAFNKIAAANATFVTRGDKSGTNSQELRIWAKTPYNATVTSSSPPSWYISTGQGMGPTLTITSDKQAYTLSDRATYLAYQKNIQLDILNQGDPLLLNIYHVIQVNPEKFPAVNAAGARAFVDFMISPDTQKLIGQFGVAQYGQPLFFPDYGKKESDLGSV
jgi:tungstate transport system substrate-binding protein